ncbi:MAG: single-stranded-DNA-specific exonuclease RecJ [Candidatus Gottesmanbacteria bacterium]|nr:single-stranded-DNA-specific exonuclease RecJ [Candidatus Gottesmanbacteria bacterium]
MKKKWKILSEKKEDIIQTLLSNRGLVAKKDIGQFLHSEHPGEFTAKDVDIDPQALKKAIARIHKAIKKKESIVVYADYDADGITAGAIMWETIHAMGGNVMPYIPHRVEEGYGLSVKGIDAVREQYDPSLIITVDHGITAYKNVAYAKSLGIDVIVTDHHVKPDKLPECCIVHTTSLCGAGVSWFVANALSGNCELLALASIGTIADIVSLTGANRSIVKYGLKQLNQTRRVGILALLRDAGLTVGELTTYDVSHMLAPRLNAMGRLVHAMDALRLLCTHRQDKAMLLARKLGLTNKERQQLTIDTSVHAKNIVHERLKEGLPKLLFVSHESYNQGVIGLVAGKLVEEYYRPAIVVAQGPEVSKASARSIPGFNIVEAIKSCSDILVDVGGHPMAAGFTVETKNLTELQSRLEKLADKKLTDELLTRELRIDMELPLAAITGELWQKIRDFEPFGFGSPEPVFVTRGVTVSDVRLVGADGKHLKLRVSSIDAIAFGMGDLYPKVKTGKPIDIAYTIDMNTWNGRKSLQLKLRDIMVQ